MNNEVIGNIILEAASKPIDLNVIAESNGKVEATGIIQDAGGEIVKVNWSGEEDDAAYIIYQCQDKNHQKQILDKLENE